MSTILNQFNPSFKTHLSKPNEPKSNVFTCLSCQVSFPSSERQRAHYRTDWHQYNLKRKIVNLTPLSAIDFNNKVLAQQAQGKAEIEKQGLIYDCVLCKKSYNSENAFNNHVQSKKHLELEQKAEQEEEKEEEEEQVSTDENKPTFTARVLNPQLDCLFCLQTSQNVDANLTHMSKFHGFFLPDIEYLKDREGLINYLFQKIDEQHICLYCNGRGKEWLTPSAARSHMTDRGHCKMAYDESEDPEQLLKYYDFGTEETESITLEGDQDELVLENGVKLGHRKFLKQYKKNPSRKSLAPEEEEQEQTERPESLCRKERRHLAITDGQEQELKMTAEGIKEATKSKEFSRNVAFKQNTNQTLRVRIQNPK